MATASVRPVFEQAPPVTRKPVRGRIVPHQCVEPHAMLKGHTVHWTPDVCWTMAKPSCRMCWGSGVCPSWGRTQRPCRCVYRRVFSQCLHEYQRIASETGASTAQLWRNEGRRTGARPARGWHRPAENFRADFELLARRALSAEQWRVFRLMFLSGHRPMEIFAQQKLSRGRGFHERYKIMEILGQVYAETRPYGLWPIADYYAAGETLSYDTKESFEPWIAAG